MICQSLYLTLNAKDNLMHRHLIKFDHYFDCWRPIYAMLKTEIETIFSIVQIFTGLIYKVIDLFIYLYTWKIG